MASSLRRIATHSPQASWRSSLTPIWRQFASEALVEIKPGEIGMVSGIPDEHLRRRWENPLMGWTSTGDPYANVKKRHTPLLKEIQVAVLETYMLRKIKSYADNFKWKGPPKTAE
ncbi:hypothetical protein HAX54_032173 [Datura stramonium]|uniref:Uncharacterized protein n=1 Tax=Datura stramonium TaxID=4076 RepID=A0ABS8VAC4_DATST|nr:hypothetical protein [Datura stramonium]